MSISSNLSNATEFYINWKNEFSTKRNRRQSEVKNLCDKDLIYVAAEEEYELPNITSKNEVMLNCSFNVLLYIKKSMK